MGVKGIEPGPRTGNGVISIRPGNTCEIRNRGPPDMAGCWEGRTGGRELIGPRGVRVSVMGG